MGGKKKADSAKWSLAGDTIYSSALAPSEERVFKETVSHFHAIASQMREEFDRFSGAVAIVRAGQQTARASVGFFCKYFEGKYQRIEIVKALATAASLPAPSAEHLGTSMAFMLGAALWLLDYVKSQELEDRFYPLLPEELDDDVMFETPDVNDLNHSHDEILGVMSVLMNRKGSSRQAFRKMWSLVDKETSRKIKEAFKGTLLDYFDRFLEVSTRVSPSAAQAFGEAPALLSNPAAYGRSFDAGKPYEPDLPESPAKDHAGLWFLTNTALLIGAPPEKIQKTLYYRRSSELMTGFRIGDPYAVCAAYMLLELDGDVLANLNMLTAAVILCAERHLPWGSDCEFTYVAPFEKSAQDYALLYPFRPREDAEEENLPDPDIEEGDLLSESQLYYLATGYVLPRDQAPSSRLKSWFVKQGVPQDRAEALAWSAWFSSYVDKPQMSRPLPFDTPDDFVDFLKSLDNELTEMAEAASEGEDSAAQVVELTRQLKESRRVLHEAEQNVRQLQERLHSAEAATLQDRAELSQLRETMAGKSNHKRDEPPAARWFPGMAADGSFFFLRESFLITALSQSVFLPFPGPASTLRAAAPVSAHDALSLLDALPEDSAWDGAGM